jgi:oligopeptidase B
MQLVHLVFLSALAGQPDAGPPKPPVAKKVPKVSVLHGEKRGDDYYWLREKSNPDVIAYLEAENTYTRAVMKPTEPLQARLYEEMLARIKQTDVQVPYREGGYGYYSRTVQGMQYPIHCRKHGSLDAPEEVLLDLNEMAKGTKFLSLGSMAVSDDANLLAFVTDVTGFREYTLRVKDLRTGQVLPDRVDKVSSFAWAADNHTLFCVTEDAAKRPYQLRRHVLGETTDQTVCEEKDELYRLTVRRSLDREYLFTNSTSATTSEVGVLPASRPTEAPRILLPRENDHRYRVEHRKGLFYILSDKGAKNFRLVTAPVNDPRPASWKELIPARDDVLLEGLTVFADHCVVTELEHGVPHVRVLDLQNGTVHRVELPEPVRSIFLDHNREFESRALRFRYQSFITPDSVFEYQMDSRERKLLKQTEVRGGYDPARYQSERIFAVATDGEKVPVSLVYRKDLARDGRRPLLLVGYGAYGFSQPVTFDSRRLSLLDRGVIVALAHIRGGSENGKQWYERGKMMQKRNTFTDFIAAAEHLVAAGYTSKDRLVIQGGSAGGLLIGAVVNMRPDLCRAAVLRVPFVDVINTMLDESLPLTVQEFLEWGNPKIKEQYDYMKSYCPYSNVAARDYPAMLVLTSLNDSQVMYWEPAKFVAKLRVTKTDSNPLLFKITMAAGHGGPSGRYDALREEAFAYGFILGQMGIRE